MPWQPFQRAAFEANDTLLVPRGQAGEFTRFTMGICSTLGLGYWAWCLQSPQSSVPVSWVEHGFWNARCDVVCFSQHSRAERSAGFV